MIDFETLPIRVRALLAARGADVSNLRSNRILALLPTALRLLANSVTQSPDLARRNLLRTSHEVDAINGEIDLEPLLTAAEPLLIEGIRRATLTFPDLLHPAQFRADRASMTYPATTEFIYWTLEGTKLLVADFNGLDSYSNTGMLRNAPFVPTLNNVHVQSTLGDELVSIVAGLASMEKAA